MKTLLEFLKTALTIFSDSILLALQELVAAIVTVILVVLVAHYGFGVASWDIPVLIGSPLAISVILFALLARVHISGPGTSGILNKLGRGQHRIYSGALLLLIVSLVVAVASILSIPVYVKHGYSAIIGLEAAAYLLSVSTVSILTLLSIANSMSCTVSALFQDIVASSRRLTLFPARLGMHRGT